MGSPTGISSEGCDPAPPALLDDSTTSEGVAAAGAPSLTTHLCLGAVPGLQQKANISDSKLIKGTKNHSTGYLTSLLALLFRTVVLGFLGQLVPTSGPGLPSRAKDSTPPVLPFTKSARVIRSSESELDRFSETFGSKSGRYS